ncbi:hypothetical protein CFP56_019136 [Quercus suber]|uniref:Uncharacterized protein n=1 Tax=Quercus suber TaxID=58331 RepID=A0AAW0M2P6_QUESU
MGTLAGPRGSCAGLSVVKEADDKCVGGKFCDPYLNPSYSLSPPILVPLAPPIKLDVLPPAKPVLPPIC